MKFEYFISIYISFSWAIDGNKVEHRVCLYSQQNINKNWCEQANISWRRTLEGLQMIQELNP